MRILATLAVLATFAMPAAARAQVIPGRVRPDTTRPGARDTTKKDTLALAAPDSMERALMSRKGFEATRYQGDSVAYEHNDGRLLLFGGPALVSRGPMRVSGTSITYEDIKQMIVVVGNPGRVQDPSRGEDIVASKPITYYIDERRGNAHDVQTSASSGSVWYVRADAGGYLSDSNSVTMYGSDAKLTTDPRLAVPGDSVRPDWYFRVGEFKQITKHVMVARPAILHIGEVPVMWIPWLAQDLRSGRRRSGILAPRFGVSDIVRNTPTYRRTIEDVGFFLAPSDYYDFELAFGWRSGARPSTGDPGWTTWDGSLRYAWLDRFINGSMSVGKKLQNDGTSNTTFHWQHRQQISKATQFTADVSYMTSTTIQQQTALNPYAAIGNINSNANYSTQLGPLLTSIGFGQRQYPGRPEIDREFPNINITTKPVELASWLTWTPSFNAHSSQQMHIDQAGEFQWRRVVDPNGSIDSVRAERSSHSSSISLGTPFKVGDFTIAANASATDMENNYPEARLVIDPVDTAIKRTIVYKHTYLTQFDWNLGVNLPSLSPARWHVTPSVSLQNVDPGGYLVRSERTGADFVSQSKRLIYGLSVSPTFYGLEQHGIGPFSAFRNSVSPSLSYAYSPAASVSDAYLAALGRVRPGYLGAIAQNRVSLSITTSFEGKFRQSPDSAQAGQQARKTKLLSLNFTPVEYDFERARVTKRSGFATEHFTVGARSDLLPGFDVSVGYSLFDAPLISDSARFKPYPDQVHATLSLGRGAGGLGPLARLLHWATGEAAPASDSARRAAPAAAPGGGPSSLSSSLSGLQSFIGGRSRGGLPEVPTGQGWQMTLTFSATHPRPPHGSNIINVDPTAVCNVFRDTNPLQYDVCVKQQSPVNTDLTNQTTAGGVAYRIPPQTSINGSFTFPLTPNWSAQWQTMYDMEKHSFASQIVSLQRELRDWRASFGFTEGANGNVQFQFLVTLKPVPDINVPYRKESYRSSGTPR